MNINLPIGSAAGWKSCNVTGGGASDVATAKASLMFITGGIFVGKRFGNLRMKIWPPSAAHAMNLFTICGWRVTQSESVISFR